MFMREILFRGKRLYDGEWIEGNLFIPDLPDTPTQICMGTNVVRISYDVDPKTIGQSTGLYDKNGKKIFEGDIIQGTIVSAWNKELIRCEIVYNKDAFISVERKRNQDWVHKVKFAKDIEVIGNIYDNPELLGE